MRVVLYLVNQIQTKDDLHLFSRDRHMASRWLAKVGRTAQYIKQEAAKSTTRSAAPPSPLPTADRIFVPPPCNSPSCNQSTAAADAMRPTPCCLCTSSGQTTTSVPGYTGPMPTSAAHRRATGPSARTGARSFGAICASRSSLR